MNNTLKDLRFLWRTMLLGVDTLCFIGSFFLAYFVRTMPFLADRFGLIQNLDFYYLYLPLLLLCLYIALHTYKLYTNTLLMGYWREGYLLMRAIVGFVLGSIGIFFIIQSSFSRLLLALWAIVLFVSMVLFRFILKNVQFLLVRKEILSIRIMLIGSAECVALYKKRIALEASLGVCVSGVYVVDAARASLDEVEKIAHSIETHTSDEVYILDASLATTSVLDLLSRISDRGVIVRLSLPLFSRVTRIAIGEHPDVWPLLDMQRINPSRIYLAGKRLMDIVLGTLAFILALPVMFIISLCVSRTSRGPVIIKQRRAGLHGKEFTLYKFRSMYESSDLYTQAPQGAGDSRVTPFGSLLRKTSLDELPQLWNVIVGDMSLVGPRPEMPFIVARYKPWQRMRLLARPGLTGLWQVLGRKDAALSDHLEYDMYYITNRGFLFDIIILMKTIPVVLFGVGAY